MKYLFLVGFLVAGCGGGDDCTSVTACATGSSTSYRFCTAGASDCYYKTGDGQKYHCTTCGDCTSARDLIGAWCAAQPASPRGTGNDGDLGKYCSGASTPCSSGKGSFLACASPNGTDCGLKTTDGTVFKCNSCSDCTAAANQAASWCEGDNSQSKPADLSTGACDVTAQNCGSSDKCVGIVDSSGNVSGTCVANGSAGQGMPCTMQMSDTTYLDDCQAGLVCSDFGPNNVALCRKICTADSQCPGGQRCMDVFGSGATWGWCEPTCTPFSSAAGNCPPNNECSSNADDIATTSTEEPGFFLCRPKGSGLAYSSCNLDSDCGPNLWCDGSDQNGPICTGICNAGHPCPQPAGDGGEAGFTATCAAFSDQSGAGYCVLQ